MFYLLQYKWFITTVPNRQQERNPLFSHFPQQVQFEIWFCVIIFISIVLQGFIILVWCLEMWRNKLSNEKWPDRGDATIKNAHHLFLFLYVNWRDIKKAELVKKSHYKLTYGTPVQDCKQNSTLNLTSNTMVEYEIKAIRDGCIGYDTSYSLYQQTDRVCFAYLNQETHNYHTKVNNSMVHFLVY